MMNHQLVKLGTEDDPHSYRTSTGRTGYIYKNGEKRTDYEFRPYEGEELKPKITLHSPAEGLQFLFGLPKGETIEIEYSTPGVLSLLPYYQSSVPFV